MSETINETGSAVKVKIALSKGDERILVDDMMRRSGYAVDGIAIYDGEHAILMSTEEMEAAYGGTSADLHEDDERRGATCSMTDFDGSAKTDFVIGYFHLGEGTAPVAAKAYGWLPDSGEAGLIAENREKVNELLSLVGGTPVGEGLYWTSVKYSSDYVWHCDMKERKLRMYKGMKEQLAVRAVRALDGYEEV